jgi:predicted RNase H-like HicB family nuclease
LKRLFGGCRWCAKGADHDYEEALAEAKTVIRLYLEVARELGKPIPEPVAGTLA